MKVPFICCSAQPNRRDVVLVNITDDWQAANSSGA
jgi:hypothetical protein